MHSCEYNVHVRNAKETMVNQINRLQAQYKVTDSILGAIASNKDSADIVQLLREGHSYKSILGKITKSPSSEREEKGEGPSYGSKSSSSHMNESWVFAHSDISRAEQKSDQLRSAAPAEIGSGSPDTITYPTSSVYQSPKSGSANTTLIDDETYPSSTSRSEVSERDDYIDPSEPWSMVTEDNIFIEHLMSLYFC